MIEYNSIRITKYYWHYFANRLRKACFYSWRGPSMLPHWALLLTLGSKKWNNVSSHVITLLRNESPSFDNLCWSSVHIWTLTVFCSGTSSLGTQRAQKPSHSKYICQNILSSPITNVKVLTYLPNSNSLIFHNIFFYCSNSFVGTYCYFLARAEVFFHRLSNVTESMKPLANTTICEKIVPINFLQVFFNFAHIFPNFYIAFNNSTLFVNHVVRHFSTMRVYRDVINVTSRY